MAEADPSFHIREQIAQMETEILQHELLIRRQKHVLNSIKQMIPVSPTAQASASSAIPQRTTTAPSSAISRLINQAGGSNQAKTSAPSVASSSSAKKQAAAASARPPTAPAAAKQKTNGAVQASAKPGHPYLSVRGPAVRQKKRAALSKVADFCKIIPKFGTTAPPKRKRTSKEMAEAAEAEEFGAPSQPVSTRKKRRSIYQEYSDEEEEEDALLFRNHDIQSMLTTAQAKLQSFLRGNGRSAVDSGGGGVLQPPVRAPMQVVDLQELSELASSSAVAGTSSAVKPTSSRPAASAVSKASNSSIQSSSASAGPSARKTGAAPAVISGAQVPSRVAVVPGKTLSSSSSAHPASARSAEALSAARLVQPVQSPLNTRAQPSKAASGATATTTALSSSTGRQAAAPSVPVTTQSTPVRTPAQTSSAAALIGSNSKLLSGSVHKALDVIEHCRRQTALEDRLEIAKDLHANILSNPRRLQHLLDSAGGRDLFISWLQEAMDALSASAVAVVTGRAGTGAAAGKEGKPVVVGREEEMRLSKLIEYCVLLVNQAYWDAKSVSDLRFDKTLKNLYRLYEFKQEAHQVTVSNIVKGIWPSYRIMRKQYEGKSKSSAVLIQ